MALHTTGICDFGWKAPDFRLKGIDGAEHSLADLRGLLRQHDPVRRHT